MKRFISLLLLCATLMTVIPIMPVFAASYAITVKEDSTGSVLYSGDTWADAMAKVNAATKNVTVYLADGYVMTNNTRIKNTNGVTVTIDGNGGTVTKNIHNGFCIESPKVVIKDMNIVTGNPGTGSTFQIYAACDITIENVNVTLNDSIQWCMLNTLASGTFNVNMKNVNVVKTGNKYTVGIVRTGNDGDTNTVNFTAEDCTFDFRNGYGCAIESTPNTTSNVNFKNTTVFSNNADIVKNGGKAMSVTVTGGNFVRMGTDDGSDIFETIKPTYLCDVTVGSTKYTDWSQAVKAINNTAGNVTVTLNSGVVLPNYGKGKDGTADAIAGSTKRTVTIDGQGKYGFCSYNCYSAIFLTTNTVLKDMTIYHSGNGGAIIANGSGITTELKNVDIYTYGNTNYCAVNTLSPSGATQKMVLEDCKIEMHTALPSPAGTTPAAAIRTGNNGKSVDLDIINCVIDVRDAASRDCVYITVNGADIYVENSELLAGNGYAMEQSVATMNSNRVVIRGCSFSSNIASGKAVFKGISGLDLDTETPAENTDAYIYCVQETDPVDGKFSVRFTSAIKKDAAGEYNSLRLRVTAAYAKEVYFTKYYDITTVYEKLSGRDEEGNIKEISIENAYLCALTIDGIPDNKNIIFTVEYYGVNGADAEMLDTETFTYKNGAYANEKTDVADYALNRADLTGRYLFVSDLHYVLAERSGQKNRTDFRGYTTDERMEELCNDIRREYNLRGLDGVFVLGDLSTDDWYPGIGSSTGYVKNSCEVLWNKYLKPLQEELGIPVGIIGGNHDSYPDDVWFAFAGREKQFSMEFGDTAIIMMDTYDTDPKKGSKDDNNYANGVGCSIDIPWITAELEKYKDKENVIIASHYFANSAELANVVKKYDNVICMLDGHTHHYVTKLFVDTSVTYVNTGTYSYGTFTGDFDEVCQTCGAYGCLWGFQIVETTESGASTYRVDTDRTYTFGNGLVIDALYTKFEDTKLK